MPQVCAPGDEELEARLAELSQRQRHVLTLVCDGKQVKEIAREMGVSEQRVYQHLAAVYHGLGMLHLNSYERRMFLRARVYPLLDQLGSQPEAERKVGALPFEESDEERADETPGEAALLLAVLDHSPQPLALPLAQPFDEGDPFEPEAGHGRSSRKAPAAPLLAAGVLIGCVIALAALQVLDLRFWPIQASRAGPPARVETDLEVAGAPTPSGLQMTGQPWAARIDDARHGLPISPTVIAVSLDVTRPWPDDIPVVNVERGQRVLIKASPGTARYCPDCPVTPDGGSREHSNWTLAGPGQLAPYLWKHALICRIGEPGAPFNVGTSFMLTANRSGRLYCSMNDSHEADYWGWADNSGSWPVTVTIGIDPQFPGPAGNKE